MLNLSLFELFLLCNINLSRALVCLFLKYKLTYLIVSALYVVYDIVHYLMCAFMTKLC